MTKLKIEKTFYGIEMTTKFKKELRTVARRGKNIDKLKKVITYIATAQELPPKYKNHRLAGQYVGCYECHIEPDWLLIYRIMDDF